MQAFSAAVSQDLTKHDKYTKHSKYSKYVFVVHTGGCWVVVVIALPDILCILVVLDHFLR